MGCLLLGGANACVAVSTSPNVRRRIWHGRDGGSEVQQHACGASKLNVWPRGLFWGLATDVHGLDYG